MAFGYFPSYTSVMMSHAQGAPAAQPWTWLPPRYQAAPPPVAVPEIVLTTPEGQAIRGDHIPRQGQRSRDYRREYRQQQIDFFHNCERDLLPVSPRHQRALVRNAVEMREMEELEALERQCEREMERLGDEPMWKIMDPEVVYNEVYRLCTKSDYDSDSAPAPDALADYQPAANSQAAAQNKRPHRCSDISSSPSKRRKTAAEIAEASRLEDMRERERQRAHLTQQAQTARRLASEIRAKMNRFGIGRREMEKLRMQDEVVQRKLRKYGDELLSLYDEDEDMSDVTDEEEEGDDEEGDDDWEDPMVFEMDVDEMDVDVESDPDWDML